MRKTLIILGIIIVVGIAVFYSVRYLQMRQIGSFEECEKSKYALIQETYPATCKLPDSRSFTQELSDDEKKNLIPPQSDYYQDLLKQCAKKDDPACCQRSVENMEKNGYQVMPAIGCPDGFQTNALECVNTYAWCEPIKESTETQKDEEVCKYYDQESELMWEAACNQLVIDYDYGYTTEETKNKVREIISQYQGKVTMTLSDDSTWRVELPNDKKIYEIKNAIELVNETVSVRFNVAVEPAF